MIFGRIPAQVSLSPIDAVVVSSVVDVVDRPYAERWMTADMALLFVVDVLFMFFGG